MTTQAGARQDRRDWSAGGWFGPQLGCTLWLVILGCALLAEDLTSALAAFAGFVAANAWGWILWQRRALLPGFTGLQLLLAGIALVVALVVLLANARVPSVYLPYWTIAVTPSLMVALWGQRHLRTAGGT